MTELNDIPEMRDPLSRHWRQPADIREAPMDDTHVLLTPRQVAELAEYSASMPSGVYSGKCWRWVQHPKYGTDTWLIWYGRPVPGNERNELYVCKRRILVA